MSIKIVVVLLLLVVIVCGVVLSSCDVDPSSYTLEQHMEMASEAIEEYITGRNSRLPQEKQYPTDFQLYPLYNDNDELSHFLVEFDPYGFMFLEIDSVSLWSKITRGYRIKYYYDDYFIDKTTTWQRYRIGAEESLAHEQSNWLIDPKSSYTNRYYEVDSNNEFIKYTSSPYKIANVLDERMYYLYIPTAYLPAIKIDGKYFNLISLQEIEYNIECNKDGISFYDEHHNYVKYSIPLLNAHFYHIQKFVV